MQAQSQSAAQWLLNPIADTAPSSETSFDPNRQPATTTRAKRFERSGAAAAARAPSRVGQIPRFEVAAASGAGDTGFNSTGHKPKPKHSGAALDKNAKTRAASTGSINAPAPRANRTPVSASVAGTVPGQPPRRRLKIDDDPFAPVGFYAGTFLVKPAIEISAGHDSNPGRIVNGRGAGFYKVAPELVAKSDWERHALDIDLRGSYIGYGHSFPVSPVNCGCGVFAALASPIPLHLQRPDFTGKVNGRIDVSYDTKINTEARLRVATDNPGSPDIQAGLERYPLTTSYGGTLGVTQSYNRLSFTLNGTVDRTTYQDSTLTNGVHVSNADRDYNQLGASLRVAYELTPAIKPFVEGAFDRRVRDIGVDRSGINRDSRGTTIKAGSSFELTRLLTGEASIGMQTRDYDDPTLRSITGLLVDASLLWSVTPLTSIKLGATSAVNETTLTGVSGVVVRQYSAAVTHDFRRWLTGTAQLSTSTSDYEGSATRDRNTSASLGLVYKMTRTAQIKGEFRREWFSSNVAGSDYTANVITVGLRLQR